MSVLRPDNLVMCMAATFGPDVTGSAAIACGDARCPCEAGTLILPPDWEGFTLADLRGLVKHHLDRYTITVEYWEGEVA
jgi:hypothetical protein